jgi:DNA invertase Pin-like site-specific DNA recombinase
MSGARDDRPELAALLDYARRGDVLMVWRLDRLGRSLPHLLTIASDLQDRGIELRSLTEAIDTTTAGRRPAPASTVRLLRLQPTPHRPNVANSHRG